MSNAEKQAAWRKRRAEELTRCKDEVEQLRREVDRLQALEIHQSPPTGSEAVGPVVADELKYWCEREQTHAAKARDCWPEIARRMAQRRKDYSSDQAFAVALQKDGIECDRNDMIAFVWMGQLKPEALEDVMALRPRRSPHHLREEVESWGDDYFALVSRA